MKNKWSDENAKTFTDKFSGFGADLSELTYASRLIGEEKDLALHGGGNTSIKSSIQDIFGDKIPALYVKASGFNMSHIGPDGFVALDGEYLSGLSKLHSLSDEAMADEFRLHQLKTHKALPSIETLMHAVIPEKCVVHTHPSAILALTNRENGEAVVHEACGLEIVVIPYAKVGFDLATAVVRAFDSMPGALGIIVMHHGLITWACNPKAAYAKTMEIVSMAEKYLTMKKSGSPLKETREAIPKAIERFKSIAPVLRGLLAPNVDPDQNTGIILKPLINDFITSFMNLPNAKQLALTSPLSPDYLIRTKTFPLWVDAPRYDDPPAFRGQLT